MPGHRKWLGEQEALRLRVELVHGAPLPAVQLLLAVRHPVELLREVGRALVRV